MNNNFNTPGNLQKLIDIGISLSKEKNTSYLLEDILIEAKKMSNADGGTIYLMSEDKKHISFEIMQTDSLKIAFGGRSSPVPKVYYPVKLFNQNGKENLTNVSAVCALKGKVVNIPDAYKNKEYDFSGTKGFDKKHKYHSKSFLNLPLTDHKDNVIGVLQLINAKEKDKIISFDTEIIELIKALSSQASMALTNQLLIEQQKSLFKSFIQLVAEALEHKDQTTGGHCNRVPIITMMIADEINEDTDGTYKGFSFTEDQMEELYIAGWLHDFGKVATPENIMNKSTKLEGIYDKIDHIKIRFEIIKRDLLIEYYKRKMHSSKSSEKLKNTSLLKKIDRIQQDMNFLEKCNIGGEFMSNELKDKVRDISKNKFDINGEKTPLLSEDEVNNLSISRGTLSDQDREIMENHVTLTYELLNKMPYPSHLKQVPFFAGCHHEKLNGKGYPNGFKAEKLPLQARIIAIADVFEGLTAPDRPYKDGYKLSKAMHILKLMVNDGELDSDLFNLFIKKKLYLKYAQDKINSSQIDEVIEEDLLT